MDSASDADSVDVLLYDAETGTIDDALSVETYASVVVAEPHSDSALAMLRAALQGARVRPLIVELLQDIAEGEGVPRARFIDALAHAADATDANMTDDGDDVLESYASAAAFVYDAIVEASAHDLSVAGDVSPRALIAGLSVMVTGDQDEVVEVVFAAFDDDRDNSLSIRELEGFLRTVLALSLRLKSVGEDDTAAPHGALGEKAVKMAKSMARRTFATMDVDHSGNINRAEFAYWLRSVVGAPSGADGEHALPPMPEQRILRRILGAADEQGYGDGSVRELHSLSARVGALEARNAALESTNAALIDALSALSARLTSLEKKGKGGPAAEIVRVFARVRALEGRVAGVERGGAAAARAAKSAGGDGASSSPNLREKARKNVAAKGAAKAKALAAARAAFPRGSETAEAAQAVPPAARAKPRRDRLQHEVGRAAPLSPGDRVDLLSNDGVTIIGTVRAVTYCVEGLECDALVGIELQRRFSKYGDGDGVYAGQRYFSCPAGRAVFVPRPRCSRRAVQLAPVPAPALVRTRPARCRVSLPRALLTQRRNALAWSPSRLLSPHRVLRIAFSDRRIRRLPRSLRSTKSAGDARAWRALPTSAHLAVGEHIARFA